LGWINLYHYIKRHKTRVSNSHHFKEKNNCGRMLINIKRISSMIQNK